MILTRLAVHNFMRNDINTALLTMALDAHEIVAFALLPQPLSSAACASTILWLIPKSAATSFATGVIAARNSSLLAKVVDCFGFDRGSGNASASTDSKR